MNNEDGQKLETNLANTLGKLVPVSGSVAAASLHAFANAEPDIENKKEVMTVFLQSTDQGGALKEVENFMNSYFKTKITSPNATVIFVTNDTEIQTYLTKWRTMYYFNFCVINRYSEMTFRQIAARAGKWKELDIEHSNLRFFIPLGCVLPDNFMDGIDNYLLYLILTETENPFLVQVEPGEFKNLRTLQQKLSDWVKERIQA
jgi:hypothetical protein